MKHYLSSKTKGFTLVELLTVIAIIGILGSIVLVSVGNSRNKASDTRVLASIRQMKMILESNYLSGSYADLTANTNNIASLSGGPGEANLVQLIEDVGKQNGHQPVTTDGSTAGINDFYTDGSAVQVGPTPPGSIADALDAGITIFTTNTSGLAGDYAIYATTTAGYICIDSIGNVISTPVAVDLLSAVPMADGKVVCR